MKIISLCEGYQFPHSVLHNYNLIAISLLLLLNNLLGDTVPNVHLTPLLFSSYRPYAQQAFSDLGLISNFCPWDSENSCNSFHLTDNVPHHLHQHLHHLEDFFLAFLFILHHLSYSVSCSFLKCLYCHPIISPQLHFPLAKAF